MKTLCAAVVLLASSAIATENTEISENFLGNEVFKLDHGCAKLHLYVAYVDHSHSEDEKDITALHKQHVERMVRNRLRGANIYNEDEERMPPALLVDVIVEGSYFYLAIELSAYVARIKVENGMRRIMSAGPAIVWSRHGLFSGNDLTLIDYTLTTFTEYFIDEYRRVNAEACE